MKRFTAALMALALLALAGCSGTASKPTKLVIGFVPSQDAAKIGDKVEPMKEYLSKALGMPVETFVGTNYVGVIEGMGSKTVDVGFLPPLGYVMANADQGAQVILKSVRNGSDKYRAQLLARAEDNVPVCDLAKDAKCKATLEALKGKKLAFVDPTSASGYLFPASFLKGAGVDVEKGKYFSDVIFAGQHDAGAKAVYNKLADAAWTFEDVRTNLEKELPDIKQKLVVVATTDWIPNDTISVRKGMPKEFVEQLSKALIDYVKTPEGQAVMKDLYSITDLTTAKDEDYKVVKDMAKAMGVDLKAELSKTKK